MKKRFCPIILFDYPRSKNVKYDNIAIKLLRKIFCFSNVGLDYLLKDSRKNSCYYIFLCYFITLPIISVQFVTWYHYYIVILKCFQVIIVTVFKMAYYSERHVIIAH